MTNKIDPVRFGFLHEDAQDLLESSTESPYKCFTITIISVRTFPSSTIGAS